MVIWDDHEKGEKGLHDGKQVIVGWLPFEGEGGAVGLFEGRVIASALMMVGSC